jgi:hypothetical protein
VTNLGGGSVRVRDRGHALGGILVASVTNVGI